MALPPHILLWGEDMVKLKVYLICSAALLTAFLFGGLLYTAFQEPAAVTSAVAVMEKPVIVIDAGHGGEDSGAVDNGLYEKDINLSIALKLRDMLKAYGYEVRMTRETDVSIYDASAGTTREKKVSDLKNRTAIINSDPNQILVSIHQNKFEQSQYYGTQIFYTVGSTRSEQLGEAIRQSVIGLLQPDNHRELKPSDNEIYILSHAEVPAVIVECGFLSNPEEAARLAEDSYQQQMAFAVSCGILTYVNQRK